MLIPEDRKPGWLLPLNKHGRFSINAAKVDGVKLKKAHGNIFMLKATYTAFAIAIAIYIFAIIFAIRSAKAADFSNVSNTGLGTSYALLNSPGNVGVLHDEWDFTTSTQQIEINDVSLFMYRTGTSTYNPYLTITTDYGTWFSYTTGTIDGSSIATTTFYFPYPHPTAPNGTSFHFAVQDPSQLEWWPTIPASNGIIQNTVTTSNSIISNYVNKRTNPGPDYSYSGDAPKIIINQNVRGTLDLTLPPDLSTYGFSTGTPTGQDFGFLGNMTRDVLTWLFVPPASVMNQFNATLTDFKTKAPLGYFTLAVSAIQGMATSTNSSSTILNIVTPLGTIPFWDTSSTMHSWLIVDIVPYLLNFERVGLWLAFLFYLYERIKDLRL